MLPAHVEKSQEIQAILRDKIAALEEALKAEFGEGLSEKDFPLKETFTDGVYIREMYIPADSVIVGKIHKHAHLNFILFGKVTVATKDGIETLVGPCSMISTAGTKRALYTHTDTIWTTVHANPTEERDPEKLEALIIAPSYDNLIEQTTGVLE